MKQRSDILGTPAQGARGHEWSPCPICTRQATLSPHIALDPLKKLLTWVPYGEDTYLSSTEAALPKASAPEPWHPILGPCPEECLVTVPALRVTTFPEIFAFLVGVSDQCLVMGLTRVPIISFLVFADDFCGFAEMYPDYAEDYLYPDQTHFDSCAQTPPAPTPNGFCIDFSPENSDFGRKNSCKKAD